MRLHPVIFLLAAMAAGPAAAEIAAIRSGAHEGFTRLVIELPGPDDGWQLGRTEDGYEFRTALADTEFDYGDVFGRIPRTRIAALAAPGPGRLQIALACPCHATSFEIRPGRIVIDISDGLPNSGAKNEVALPPVAGRRIVDGQSAPADAGTVPPGPGRVMEFSTSMREDPKPVFLRVPEPSDVEPSLPLPEPQRPADAIADPVPAAAAPAMAIPADPDLPAEFTADLTGLTSLSPGPTADHDPDPTGHTATGRAPAPERPSAMQPADFTVSHGILFNDFARALALPAIEDPGLSATDRARVDAAQSDLIRQLQRAVAQGMIDAPLQQLTAPRVSSAETRQPTTNAEGTRPATQAEPPGPDHLFAETAADRDAADPAIRALTDAARQDCPNADWFDVAGWGPEGADPTFDSLRAGLVGEFDRTDDAAVQALARRYIYFGFGVESRAIMAALGYDGADAATLEQLSQIVDLDPDRSAVSLRAQASCSSSVALWAALALPESEVPFDLNSDALLRAFSDLPPHLRSYLGPELAGDFVASGDPGTADLIGNLMERAPYADKDALRMVGAKIALAEDDPERASRLLQTVVAEDGPDAASALADLIENRSARGLPISEQLARSADALSVEYRGTDIGRRLTRAAIRAFSVAGKPETTFERIDDAATKGSITEEEARELRAEALLDAARAATDEVFLTMAYKHPFAAGAGPSVEPEARRAVATRLLQLGFVDQAELTLRTEGGAASADNDRILNAGIALARQKPDLALTEIDGLVADEARTIAARAYVQQGDYAAAIAVYDDLGLVAEAAAVARRFGVWENLTTAEDAPVRDAAMLAVTGSAQVGHPTANDGATDPAQPLAAGRSLVSESSAARQVLADLLNQASGG